METREQMIERREKSRKIQENRAIRAKRWMFTDHKPKIEPSIIENPRHLWLFKYRNRWIYRGMR